MDQLVVNLLDLLYAAASLALISVGLAVVFGMMRVINLAHGEFLVLGGYVAISASAAGLNLYLSMLVVAPLVLGVVGLVIERVVIRPLYGRLIDTMLATWGLSLLLSGLLTAVYGNTTTGISSPIGAVRVGAYSVNGYSLFVVFVTLVVFVGLWGLLRHSRAGLVARAAMQSADMSAAFGHDARRIYQATFAGGAALSGLAGAVMAPLVGLSPTSGGQFIAKAFITVIAGGAAAVSGTLSSASLFGTVSQWMTVISTPVIGEIAMLAVALVVLWVIPAGLSSRWFKGGV